ncbi:hypothetical protein DPMN_066797 [Dreissena polymorpha]|uniref:Uncharacterized protein n=1 Tax=Dreissena polymorpha TaxID=45954 RepID=A0A9D3YW67_DREPO|nr:hypothetical protein DPMN_066797 [Dreissena polymorpha]
MITPICTGVFRVTTAKSAGTTVQLPPCSLMVRGLKFVPVLSSTHTDNQGISTAIAGRYTAVLGPFSEATRTFPDTASIPDLHGSKQKFELPKTAVFPPEAEGNCRTFQDLQDRHSAPRRLHGSHAGMSRI